MTEKKYSIDEVNWIRYCENKMTIIEGLIQRLGPQMSEGEIMILVEKYEDFDESLKELGVIRDEVDELKNTLKKPEKPDSEERRVINDQIKYP